MTKKLPKRVEHIFSYLEEQFHSHPMPIIDLLAVQEDNPYKILTATILSARTKDETTAVASLRLFEKEPDLIHLDALTVSQIEELIYPVVFYKNKARYLSQLPKAIFTEFDGSIPETVEELVKLPGVGRKTANLVSTIAFQRDALCVDTHVHRISNRLGWIQTGTPYESEMALRKFLPKKYWKTVNAYLVSLGMHLCRPIRPKCDECKVTAHCAHFKSETTTKP